MRVLVVSIVMSLSTFISRHATKRRGDLASRMRYENLMKGRYIFVLAVLTLGTCAASGPPDEVSARARALESRLRAPCCWIQTLDVHESELSTKLREEIEERLRRGETSVAIEDDFAARYGERVRAVPRGMNPMGRVPALLGIGIVTSFFGLLSLVRRWRRRAGDSLPISTAGAPTTTKTRDEYDDRIEDELSRLDDL